ncbi:MAG TPA: YciI family protein [Acidimicrobiales bacterium]|nr:YciI family protein [Acidimicrobiales bacterium]
MLVIYGNEDLWTSFPEKEWKEVVAAHDTFQRELTETGELVRVEGLTDAENAKVVRVADGVPVVTDGPYLEAKEYMGSFFVVDCESIERAIELAARLPMARFNGVEVWPLMDHGGTEM